MPLHHGTWRRIEAPHRGEANGRNLGGQRLGADHEYRIVTLKCLGEQSGRTLGAGDNVAGGGHEAQGGEVFGDLGCGPAGVVGDV